MSSRYAFFLGGVSGLFALAVHSLVDFNLHVPANALTGVVVLALVAGNVRFATKRYWVRARPPLQWALTGGLGALMIYLGAQTWRRGGEMIWTDRAEVLPVYSNEQAAALQTALACEPKNYLTAYKIGECFRMQSLNGGDDYAELGTKSARFLRPGHPAKPA